MQVSKSTFNALINEDYFVRVDIENYHCILEHAISNVDFAIDTYIYMLTSKLNLNKGKTAGYKNEILIRNIGLKIALHRNINKTGVCHQKVYHILITCDPSRRKYCY